MTRKLTFTERVLQWAINHLYEWSERISEREFEKMDRRAHS